MFPLWFCIGDAEALVGPKAASFHDSHGFWYTLSKSGASMPQWVFLGTQSVQIQELLLQHVPKSSTPCSFMDGS